MRVNDFMKHLLISLLYLFAVSASAQPRVNGVAVVPTTNSSYWYFENGGNVHFIDTIYSGLGAYAFWGDSSSLLWGGLRTNNGLARLGMYSIKGASGSSNSHFLVEIQGDNYGLLEFGANTGSSQSATLSAEATYSQMDFSIKNNNIQKVFLRANATSGYIGVNTNNPQAALHVNGSAIMEGPQTNRSPIYIEDSGAGSVTLNGSSSGSITLTVTNNGKTNTVIYGLGTISDGDILTFTNGFYTNQPRSSLFSGSGSGGSVYSLSNIVASTTNASFMDFGTATRVNLSALTNNHLILTNIHKITNNPLGLAILSWQQDSNGTRTIPSILLVGGVLQTNGTFRLDTNANAETLIFLTAGKFATNLVISTGGVQDYDSPIFPSADMATNTASFKPFMTNAVAGGQFWTNTSGQRLKLKVSWTLLGNLASGFPSLCMTNISSGEAYNPTNGFVLTAPSSGRTEFHMSPGDYFIATNKSSGSASATVDSSFGVKE